MSPICHIYVVTKAWYVVTETGLCTGMHWCNNNAICDHYKIYIAVSNVLESGVDLDFIKIILSPFSTISALLHTSCVGGCQWQRLPPAKICINWVWLRTGDHYKTALSECLHTVTHQATSDCCIRRSSVQKRSHSAEYF